MKYLTERSLYYYFLMREITDIGTELWATIAADFGVSSELIRNYEITLQDPVLADLLTAEDIEVYKNYISGFFCKENCFGKSATESDTIDAKLLALLKVQQLFGNTQLKRSRLQALSHIYETDHETSVLYALHIIHFNRDKSCRRYAEDILSEELYDGKNCDAGFILLQLRSEETDNIVNCLKSLPEMLIHPEMLSYLTHNYGGSSEVTVKSKHPIGF